MQLPEFALASLLVSDRGGTYKSNGDTIPRYHPRAFLLEHEGHLEVRKCPMATVAKEEKICTELFEFELHKGCAFI